MSYLKYKGYLGTIEPQIESGTLYGKLAFIRDLITYESGTLSGLKQEFEFSVNEYLKDCKELDKTPDTPCKGSFNVRISPDLHRQAIILSGNDSLNVFVSKAIAEKVHSLAV